MDEALVAQALEPLVGGNLSSDLASSFCSMRRDYATKTLGRSSPGKFVETFVQCLQQISTGSFDKKPAVDEYLNKKVDTELSLDDGLRICGARIARSIYTLRNKRSIAHKNDIDPNTFDLAFCHNGAAWIMAELVRTASGLSMDAAGKIIDLIQSPVGSLVEEIDGTRLVHADLSVRDEILVLLHSEYPNAVHTKSLITSMKARSKNTIRNRLAELRLQKLVHGDTTNGFKLTLAGHASATSQIRAMNV